MRAERDQLLAEKANWVASAPPTGSTSEAPPAWDAEKTALTAARDKAEAELKVRTLRLDRHMYSFSFSLQDMTAKFENSSNTAKSNKAAFVCIDLRC